MVKAFKYTRHYVIDFINGDYGQVDEIFIRDYGIAVCFINDSLRVFLADAPRTKTPISITPSPTATEEEIKGMVMSIPERFRNYVPSPITEIEIQQTDAENLFRLAQAQKEVERLTKTLQENIKQYIH